MKIFRFVNDLGNGLYQDNFHTRLGLVYDGEDIPSHQPILYEDGLPAAVFIKIDQYKCAFLNADQIMSWFRDIDPLTIFVEGGKLLELTLEDRHVIKCKHQCCFLPHCVITEREIDVDEFIELIYKAEIHLQSVLGYYNTINQFKAA